MSVNVLKIYCCALVVLFMTIVRVASGAEQIKNEDVVRMVQAGLGEDLIERKIRSSEPKFDLQPTALVALKKQGVSDRIIGVMMDEQENLSPKAKRETSKPDGVEENKESPPENMSREPCSRVQIWYFLDVRAEDDSKIITQSARSDPKPDRLDCVGFSGLMTEASILGFEIAGDFYNWNNISAIEVDDGPVNTYLLVRTTLGSKKYNLGAYRDGEINAVSAICSTAILKNENVLAQIPSIYRDSIRRFSLKPNCSDLVDKVDDGFRTWF